MSHDEHCVSGSLFTVLCCKSTLIAVVCSKQSPLSVLTGQKMLQEIESEKKSGEKAQMICCIFMSLCKYVKRNIDL